MKSGGKFQLFDPAAQLKIKANTAAISRERSTSKGPQYGAEPRSASLNKRRNSASNSKSRERPVRGPSGPNAIFKPPATSIMPDPSLINMANLNKRVTFLENAQPKVP